MQYHLTPRSGNAKTGAIPVSTTTAKTCPTACPIIGFLAHRSGARAVSAIATA